MSQALYQDSDLMEGRTHAFLKDLRSLNELTLKIYFQHASDFLDRFRNEEERAMDMDDDQSKKVSDPFIKYTSLFASFKEAWKTLKFSLIH